MKNKNEFLKQKWCLSEFILFFLLWFHPNVLFHDIIHFEENVTEGEAALLCMSQQSATSGGSSSNAALRTSTHCAADSNAAVNGAHLRITCSSPGLSAHLGKR